MPKNDSGHRRWGDPLPRVPTATKVGPGMPLRSPGWPRLFHKAIPGSGSGIPFPAVCVLAMAAALLSTGCCHFLPQCPAVEGVSWREMVLDHDTRPHPDWQKRLEAMDADLRERHGMTTEHTAVGLLDLQTGGLAMIHPDRIEYAASIPKIGILLAWFYFHPQTALEEDPPLWRDLGLMVKSSSNPIATRFSRQIGLPEIQSVLDQYGFYDRERGGGLWMGKHYGPGEERVGDPVADVSHGATVRQLLRFYLLMEQERLISPEASRAMRRIFASPEIPHDPIKFVRGLEGRDLEILRKWGTWRDWRHDSAIVTGPGRHYILAALTRHPAGDEYLADLARLVDDFLTGSPD